MGTVPGAEICNGCIVTASCSAQCRKERKKKKSKIEGDCLFYTWPTSETTCITSWNVTGQRHLPSNVKKREKVRHLLHLHQIFKIHCKEECNICPNKSSEALAVEVFHTDPVQKSCLWHSDHKARGGYSLPCNSFWAKSKRFSLECFLYSKHQCPGTIVLGCHAICRLIISTHRHSKNSMEKKKSRSTGMGYFNVQHPPTLHALC